MPYPCGSDVFRVEGDIAGGLVGVEGYLEIGAPGEDALLSKNGGVRAAGANLVAIFPQQRQQVERGAHDPARRCR